MVFFDPARCNWKQNRQKSHSFTVSLAAFEIFAFVGKAFFIILLTFAIGRNQCCSRGDNSLFPAFGAPPDSLYESAIAITTPNRSITWFQKLLPRVVIEVWRWSKRFDGDCFGEELRVEGNYGMSVMSVGLGWFDWDPTWWNLMVVKCLCTVHKEMAYAP